MIERDKPLETSNLKGLFKSIRSITFGFQCLPEGSGKNLLPNGGNFRFRFQPDNQEVVKNRCICFIGKNSVNV